ncbi:MAG: lysylphosphatidylglycerol synthase transmembrane domain-containing protein [Adhaeribacter sp.]
MNKVLDVLKYVFLFGLSVFLMGFALKGINFDLLKGHLEETNYYWLGFSLAVALAGFLSRAYRWKMQLKPFNAHIRFADTYHATMIGYLANLVLPRMGEVIRCSMLKRSNNIPVESSFGTVITERLLDMVMLLALTGLAFVVEFDRLNAFFVDLLNDKYRSLQQSKSLLLLLGGLLLAGILALIVVLVFFLNSLRENRFFRKIVSLARGFLAGIFSIAKLENKPAFIGHTLFIWLSYYLMGFLAFFALPATANLSPVAALTVLVMGSFGMSVPVQGGIGVFHIMVRSALLLYGVSREAGMAFALINHTSQTLLVVLLGGISFILSLSKKKKPAPDLGLQQATKPDIV